MKVFLILILLLFVKLSSAQTFTSGEQQVPLLELYTSEGCSSCPPADRWLSDLSDHESLWSGFVPMAWHVDYWDYIGWKDPFASREYSQRQRRYAQEYNERTVYTPGVRKAGQEWRTWRRFGQPTNKQSASIGDLQFTVDEQGAFSANFLPSQGNVAGQLNVAVLGLDLSTEVLRGENRGKTLKHDFVVLRHARFAGADTNQWSGLIEQPAVKSKRYAIAVWISEKGHVSPLQSTGGYLSAKLWRSAI